MGVRKDKATYNAYMREYNRKNPDKRKHGDLKKKYNISYSDYERMFEVQAGVCQICKKPETQVHPITKATQMLAVDHCHRTNKVRALLCSKCNRTLGLVDDNIEQLEALIQYLKEFKH